MQFYELVLWTLFNHQFVFLAALGGLMLVGFIASRLMERRPSGR
jgi:hypothetical protein